MQDDNVQHTQLRGNWHYPTEIIFGVGSLAELPNEVKRLGMRSPLFVTDSALVNFDFVTDTVDALRASGIETSVFSELKANPTGGNIDDGVAAYRQGGHDGVVVLGGGSALDVGKAIAFMVGQSLPIWSFEDVGDNWQQANLENIAPVIAIPSTSGTGSEVGRSSVITDEAECRKKIIFHPAIMPELVIADPAITIQLPVNITAATGVDAFVHNFEAFCAPGYHPMADGIALEGMRLIKENLPRACLKGDDLAARSQLMVASTMGATAFQKGLGGVHALAHTLGALYDAHHGLLNAILLPYVVERNFNVIQDKLKLIAQFFGLSECSAEGLLIWLRDFLRQLDIPRNLSAIGIDTTQAQRVGKMATEDAAAGGNPISLTAQDYAGVFTSAVKGS